MNRFVVLKHEFPPSQADASHWDLMLEQPQGLATWRLDHWPPDGPQSAQQLPLHRHHYLTYEGPVSGNRGEVTRVESGHYETLLQTTTRWQVHLRGGQFSITLDLIQNNQDPQLWEITSCNKL